MTVETDMKTRFVPKNANEFIKNDPSDILKPANISLENKVASLEMTAHTYQNVKDTEEKMPMKLILQKTK